MKTRLADNPEFNTTWLPIAAQVVNLQKMCEDGAEVERLAETIEALKESIDTLWPLLPVLLVTTFDERFKPQFMECLTACGINIAQIEDLGNCGLGNAYMSIKVVTTRARVKELVKAFSLVLDTAHKAKGD